MNKVQLTPDAQTLLLDGPNDGIYMGPCRMSLGATKMVGAQFNMGTAAPGNPGGTQPHMDRSREYCAQEYIFEDLLSRNNTLLFPGHRQGRFDVCGRDVILVAYYKEVKTFAGKTLSPLKKLLPQLEIKEVDKGMYIIAVMGMHNGHVVSDTDYGFWNGPISVDRKKSLASIISHVHSQRQNYMSYFMGGPVNPDSSYA